MGQGGFTVTIPGGDRYVVTITKDFANCGGMNCNDKDGIEAGVQMVDVQELAVLKEMIGSTPKITIWGLMIGHKPITLVASGSNAFDTQGHFSASTLPLVPVPNHGNQPSAIAINGTIAVASITFTIHIDATSGATFQFGHDYYTGSGPKKP